MQAVDYVAAILCPTPSENLLEFASPAATPGASFSFESALVVDCPEGERLAVGLSDAEYRCTDGQSAGVWHTPPSDCQRTSTSILGIEKLKMVASIYM